MASQDSTTFCVKVALVSVTPHHQRMWFLIWLSCLGFAESKHAYPPQTYSSKGIERLRAEGVRGTIIFKGRATKHFRVQVKHSKGRRFEDWHLVVERRRQTLHIEVFNVLYGVDWKRQIKRDLWPEFDIEIEGPSLPLQVSWREGRMGFQHWKAPVEGSFLSGQLDIAGGVGVMNLQVGDVDVVAKDFRGDFYLKGERGAVDIADMRGRLFLSWLAGPVNLKNVRGEANMERVDGKFIATQSSGKWSLNALHGSVFIREFAGELKGKGETASWIVTAQKGADVEIVSRSGPIDVHWLQGGAKVFLASKSGTLRAPKIFKIQDREGSRVIEGRKGLNPTGQLFVRTSTGSISFR